MLSLHLIYISCFLSHSPSLLLSLTLSLSLSLSLTLTTYLLVSQKQFITLCEDYQYQIFDLQEIITDLSSLLQKFWLKGRVLKILSVFAYGYFWQLI